MPIQSSYTTLVTYGYTTLVTVHKATGRVFHMRTVTGKKECW